LLGGVPVEVDPAVLEVEDALVDFGALDGVLLGEQAASEPAASTTTRRQRHLRILGVPRIDSV